MQRFLFCLAILGVLLGAGGCSSTPTSSEPDEALRPRVEAWERQKSGDWSVRDLVKDSEIHDADFIQHEIEGLSVVYPGHVPTLMACAIVAYDQKQLAKSQEDPLDRVLALAPDHPDATLLRARIALADGNGGLARKLLEEEVRFRPDHASVRETLAGVYFTLGRYDDARATLDVAERLGARASRVAFDRGLVEEATGHATLAASLYAKALAANPESPAARARLRALQASAPGTPVLPPADRPVDAALARGRTARGEAVGEAMEAATSNRKKLLNRVRRIRGQIDSIERALAENQEDATTLQTLAACRGAIAGLMTEIVEERVRLHLLDPARDTTNQARILQEIHEIFRTYLK